MLTARLTCLVFIGSSYAVLKHDFLSFSTWWVLVLGLVFYIKMLRLCYSLESHFSGSETLQNLTCCAYWTGMLDIYLVSVCSSCHCKPSSPVSTITYIIYLSLQIHSFWMRKEKNRRFTHLYPAGKKAEIEAITHARNMEGTVGHVQARFRIVAVAWSGPCTSTMED